MITLEILKFIVTMCQVPNSQSYAYMVAETQLKCQKQMVACIKKRSGTYTAISDCILEQK